MGRKLSELGPWLLLGFMLLFMAVQFLRQPVDQFCQYAQTQLALAQQSVELPPDTAATTVQYWTHRVTESCHNPLAD